MTADGYLHVAAAAVLDTQGRVLIARRAAKAHQGNLWEFPGGKVEPGETVEAALERELWEELHIRPTRKRPLIRVPHRYPDRKVLLDVWRVEAFDGVPVGREGQPIEWVWPAQLPHYPFPDANRPIVSAVRLPACYVISEDCPPGGESAFLQRLSAVLEAGHSLVQLRCRKLEGAALDALLSASIQLCRQARATVLVNATPDRAMQLGADGAHLAAPVLASQKTRGLPPDLWLAASCHDAAELARARALGVDFAVLSPVKATASHPGTRVVGWEGFADLARDVPFPVYALGGVGNGDLPAAWEAGGQGVAGIRAFWRD